MKKSILFISFLCFSVAMFAQEVQEEQPLEPQQEQQQQEQQLEPQPESQPELQSQQPQEVKGVHPYKVEENQVVSEEYAHWSLIPHAGFNAFDGDFTSEMKHNVAVPAAGVALEYNFTPVWSIGIEYMYDMYTITGNPNQVDAGGNKLNADTLLHGHMHKAGGYLAMDFVNLIFPRAEKKIVSIIPYVGGGAAWYRRACYYKDDKYFDASIIARGLTASSAEPSVMVFANCPSKKRSKFWPRSTRNWSARGRSRRSFISSVQRTSMA